MHLLALSIYGVCGFSLVLGVVIFTRNFIRRGDSDYEARFPWWVRLSLYLVVFVLPPAGWLNGVWLNANAPWWVHLLLYLVAFAIPAVGLVGSLWLGVFRKTRERVRLAKGLLFVSLVPLVFLIGTSVDPAARVTSCTSVF
jgi:cytochrome b561